MTAAVAVSAAFEADPANVGRARSLLRGVMMRSGGEAMVDSAAVALSEVVTNAFVHAGGIAWVHVWATPDSVRVEVEDSSFHMPTHRHYATTAGTGRGLHLVDDLTDRWGTAERPGGKAVWFEIRNHPAGVAMAATADPSAHGMGTPTQQSGNDDETAGGTTVTLTRVPLLMHMAWQEHAATLLREYLLHVLDEDDAILDKHAQASAAMTLLHEQLPAPVLSDEPDALMGDAIEPHVTADVVVLQIPAAVIACFATLDTLLRSAIAEARAGHFLSPPTQPEIDEMRQWLCSEVARQAGGETTTTPWRARTDVRATLFDQAALRDTYSDLSSVDEPLLATNEASIIVAVSQPALDLLGYQHADGLLGRRVIVVVPARFHQAHIAGTTLHATNGRDNLLNVPVHVPMIRADGSEVGVHLEVRAERARDGQRVFVARFGADA